MDKTRGNGYKLLLGHSARTQEEHFSQGEQSAIGILFPGKRWIPQTGTLLRFSWTGCWAVLSRPCFCQETLDQMILEFPSSLVFYDSMKAFPTSILQKDTPPPKKKLISGQRLKSGKKPS